MEGALRDQNVIPNWNASLREPARSSCSSGWPSALVGDSSHHRLVRILAKTGYSGALGLLMFVPFANFILLLVLAFGTWPIETEVRRLRGGQ